MNRRRQPFQGCALPPELPGHFALALQLCARVGRAGTAAQRLHRRNSKAGAGESLTIIAIVLGSLQFCAGTCENSFLCRNFARTPSRPIVSGVAAVERAACTRSENYSPAIGAQERQGVAATNQGFGGGDWRIPSHWAGAIRGESLPATRQVRKRQHVTCAGQNAVTSASNPALPYFRYVGICDSEFESASTPCRVRAQKCQRSRESGIPTTNAENAFFKIKAHPVTKDATRVGNFRRRTRALLLSALH